MNGGQIRNLVTFWRMNILCHAQLDLTVALQIYIDISLLYIWITSLKEIQAQFLSPRSFVHVPQYPSVYASVVLIKVLIDPSKYLDHPRRFCKK
jgi:hypothetical protein